jgi:membrane protein YqaA with SNARE-associated domain
LVPIVAGIEEYNLITFLIIMFVAKAIKGTAIVYSLFLPFSWLACTFNAPALTA